MRIATPLIALIAIVLLQPMTARSQEEQYWLQSLPVTYALSPLMAKDASGNIYIETRTAGGGGANAFFLVKYSSDGTRQWNTSYANSKINFVMGIGVDNAQNVYVAINVIKDVLLLKYSSTGQLLWNITLTYGASYGNAMTVDAAGNTYITGFTTTAATAQAVTFKINSAGVRQWVETYINPSYLADGGYAITVDGPGNVYVAALSQSTTTGNDIETLKYGPNGNMLWVAEYTGSQSSSQETPMTITVDTLSGNVYSAGQSEIGGTTLIGDVIAYSSSGTQLWTYQDNTSAATTAVLVDYAGNVITMNHPALTESFAATKFTSAGSIQWTTSYTPSQGVPRQSFAGALDNSGNLYVTMPVGTTTVDYCTQEYYSDGTLAWTLTYNAPANGTYSPNAIAIQNPVRRGVDIIQFPEVFVTGTTSTAGSSTVDITTIMYSRPPIVARSTTADSLTGAAATLATPTVARLSNYPNPFHGATSITYTIPNDSHVTLQVYDGAGHPVANLVNEDETAGTHTMPFNAERLPAGIYAYRIIALSPQGAFTQTKQMIIK